MDVLVCGVYNFYNSSCAARLGIERVSVIRSSIYPDTSKEEDMSESVEFITADPSTELCRIDSDGAVFVNGEPATDAEFMVALREFQREQKDDATDGTG